MITLSNASRREEVDQAFSVNQNRKARGGNEGYNKLNPIRREIEEAQDMFDETLFKSVEGFFKVDFEHHGALLTL